MIEVSLHLSHIYKSGEYYKIEIKDLDLDKPESINLNDTFKIDEIDTLIKSLLEFRIKYEKEKTK